MPSRNTCGAFFHISHTCVNNFVVCVNRGWNSLTVLSQVKQTCLNNTQCWPTTSKDFFYFRSLKLSSSWWRGPTYFLWGFLDFTEIFAEVICLGQLSGNWWTGKMLIQKNTLWLIDWGRYTLKGPSFEFHTICSPKATKSTSVCLNINFMRRIKG